MDDRTKKIKELTAELTKLIKEADAEKDETRALYRFMLKNLPRTIIVQRKFQDSDCFFQGISDLFSEAEFYDLTPEEKHNLSLAFCFLKDGEAKVSVGFYNEPEIFRGTWLGAVIFIFTKFEESSVFPILSREKRDSLKRVISIFKSKTL